MASAAHNPAPDFYLACHCDVHGWGGGLAFAAGLQEALQQFGYSSLILGIDDSQKSCQEPQAARRPSGCVAPATPGTVPGGPWSGTPAGRRNLPSGVAPRLWRFRSWLLPRGLARGLGRLPPPRIAFVAVSPTWIVAARRAWPRTPVVFVFACLLANCMPFTWPRRRAPSFWTGLDYLGIRRVERHALRDAGLVLAPTQQSAEEIRAFVGHAAAPVERCDYGVCPVAAPSRLRTSTRRKISAQADHFVIALIGHCDRNKGFELAISTLADVDRRGRLLIVGDGPELGHLREQAHGEGVADRVLFVGAHRDMAPWFAAADAVLSTSHYDTFPNVVLEGMAQGLPVVVPEHHPPHVYAGMAEVVREHRCGLLYPRPDPAALTIALNRLIRDPELAARLGGQGRQAVERRYRWRTVATRILAHGGLAGSPLPVGKPTPVAAH